VKLQPNIQFSDLTPAEIAAERQRRATAGQKLADYTDPKFAKQTAFIKDPARFKLALCTRRAGKTEGACIDLIQSAQNVPGSVGIFFGRTRISAKNVAWRILRRRVEKLGLPCEVNKTELSISFPNGSMIFLAGVDATADERDKYLGMALYRVYIDECASHRQDIYELCVGVIMPALVDHDGSLILLGTPGNFTKGLFYRLSSGKAEPSDPPCSIHRWTAFDNPYMAKKWADEIDKIERERPAFKLTPLYKQHYLGEWVVDDTRLCYHYDDERNGYTEMPPGEWTHVMGVDLGYEDDTAFVVLAFSKASPLLYVREAYKRKKMDITDVANRVRYYVEKYGPEAIVVDGAAKQAVAEMVRRHKLELIASDKRDKANFMGILDAEIVQGHVLFQVEEAFPLIDEASGLIWADPKPGIQTVVRKENPACANHACDAFLYAWRYSYSYLGQVPENTPAAGSPEALRREAKALEVDAKARALKLGLQAQQWPNEARSAQFLPDTDGLEWPTPSGWEN